MPRRRKQKRQQWTTAELGILEAHASEGMKALKKLLPGRSEASIKTTASRFGISLARRWFCPRCNKTVFEPLKPSTGWCRECSKKNTLERNQLETRELLLANLGKFESDRRVEEIDKKISSTYTANSRLKKSSKIMQPRSNLGNDQGKRGDTS